MNKNMPSMTTILIAANAVVFFLAEIISGSTEQTQVLLAWGGVYGPAVFGGGQWWRLFTAMFMHAGIRHLLNNMLLLYVLGSHLERLLGKLRFGILYIAGGIAGNAAALWWYERAGISPVAVGASGAVFAVMGALIWIVIRSGGRADGLSLRQMMIMAVLSLYFGFVSSGVANSAHVGGIVSGFLLSMILYRPPVKRKRPF